MSEEYEDERYCGHCEKETQQTCQDSEHERDSSQDYQKCHECGYVKYGMSGKWRPGA